MLDLRAELDLRWTKNFFVEIEKTPSLKAHYQSYQIQNLQLFNTGETPDTYNNFIQICNSPDLLKQDRNYIIQGLVQGCNNYREGKDTTM